MSSPPPSRPESLQREPVPWPLPARLAGTVAAALLLHLGTHWLAAPAEAPLPLAGVIALVGAAAAALVALLVQLLRPSRPQPPTPAGAGGESMLAGGPATRAPAQPPALRLPVAQLLELQRQMLGGLPGPAMLMRAARADGTAGSCSAPTRWPARRCRRRAASRSTACSPSWSPRPARRAPARGASTCPTAA
ncbi:MAG: hypothetical protein U1F21_03115 [Sphaerotilus natans]